MAKLILVNERDEPIGEMEKMEAHHVGALHRAFSVFIFDEKGRMLLQQRAKTKYHSPGLWTNTCCSHPQPGEDTLQSATKRLKEEMGFETKLSPLFTFTYRAEFENGLIEHEFDHVFVGTYSGKVSPNPDEVMSYRFQTIEEIASELKSHPGNFTAWFRIAFSAPQFSKFTT